METQQQLGDGVVRTVAMGSTEGLKRGLEVSNTKAPISVPVGEATLGRIMNVLGDPIDMKGDVKTKEKMPIHRKPPAYVDLADSNEILETGIKVIDLVCPFAKGVFWFVWGKNGSTKEYECVHTADFARYKSKYNGRLAL